MCYSDDFIGYLIIVVPLASVVVFIVALIPLSTPAGLLITPALVISFALISLPSNITASISISFTVSRLTIIAVSLLITVTAVFVIIVVPVVGKRVFIVLVIVVVFVLGPGISLLAVAFIIVVVLFIISFVPASKGVVNTSSSETS